MESFLNVLCLFLLLSSAAVAPSLAFKKASSSATEEDRAQLTSQLTELALRPEHEKLLKWVRESGGKRRERNICVSLFPRSVSSAL